MWALFLMFTTSTFAYETLPEYRSLQRPLSADLIGPEKLDSEYQSDALSFYKPFSWEYLWLSQDKVFDFSAGSVSSKRFNIENRLKIKQNLSKTFNFSYHYLDDSSLVDDEDQAHLVELSYGFGEHWGLAAYGELSTRKSEDDAGLAFLFLPNQQTSVRLFYTLPDLTRNRRNEATDYFLKKPQVAGLVMRWFNPVREEFYEMAFRSELPSRWLFPDQEFIYTYNKQYFGFQGRKYVSSLTYFNSRYSWVRRYEEVQPITMTVTSEKWELREFEGLVQVEKIHWLSNWNVFMGLHYVERSWLNLNTQVRQQSILPHVWFRHVLERGARQDEVGLGLESTVYNSHGDRALRATTDKDSAVEGRLNLSYSFVFTRAELRWLFSFDLDRFGSDETWEGGSGQFRLVF